MCRHCQRAGESSVVQSAHGSTWMRFREQQLGTHHIQRTSNFFDVQAVDGPLEVDRFDRGDLQL